MKKKILFSFIFLLLFFPLLVGAENGTGLVPCGPGTSVEECQLCHLFQLLSNIVGFLLYTLVPGIATILFLYGGFYYYTSQGNPDKLGKAKKIMVSTVVGLLIVYGAHMGVSLILHRVGAIEDMRDWPTIQFENCP